MHHVFYANLTIAQSCGTTVVSASYSKRLSLQAQLLPKLVVAVLI